MLIGELTNIGWRPTLAGSATLAVGAVCGWGIAGTPTFAPVRWVRRWVERVVLRALRDPRWAVRTGFVFVNNTAICALVIAAGAWPGGAWAAIVAVGLAMGIALRTLTGAGSFAPHETADIPIGADPLVRLGLVLNLLEFPAIVVTLGLAMGRLAAPNGLSPQQTWDVFSLWVVPALLVAAGGEALWIGRRSPF